MLNSIHPRIELVFFLRSRQDLEKKARAHASLFTRSVGCFVHKVITAVSAHTRETGN